MDGPNSSFGVIQSVGPEWSCRTGNGHTTTRSHHSSAERRTTRRRYASLQVFTRPSADKTLRGLSAGSGNLTRSTVAYFQLIWTLAWYRELRLCSEIAVSLSRLWNSSPTTLRRSDTELAGFKRLLKTRLFRSVETAAR